MVSTREAEGVLLTGVYGSGKSSVAQEIAYLLEQRGEPFALLDLDYFSWAGTGTGDRAGEFRLMLQNMAAVAANYRRAGIGCSCSPTLSAASARRAACRRRWGCRVAVVVAWAGVGQRVVEPPYGTC
jgi:adenylylsulfate kinase-like enzyme